MNLGGAEVILILFVSLLIMTLPLAALAGIALIYLKLSRLEKRQHQLEEKKKA